jgi:hypothetical protein
MFGDLPLLPVTPQDVPEREHVSSALVSNGKPPSEDVLFADHRYSIDFSSLEVLNPLGIEPVLRAPRAFWPKRVRYQQLSLNRKYVICTLSTYPHIMLPGKGMPPFIHPQCPVKRFGQDGRVAQTSLPGPLATCAGIIAMWSVKNKNNSVFIWRAIRTEQERLSEEVNSTLIYMMEDERLTSTQCSKYNDWNAVAALQAICIYFLLRLSEKDDDATDFDIPLILTMTVCTLTPSSDCIAQ